MVKAGEGSLRESRVPGGGRQGDEPRSCKDSAVLNRKPQGVPGIQTGHDLIFQRPEQGLGVIVWCGPGEREKKETAATGNNPRNQSPETGLV